jgi:hypothetical protein
MRLASRITKAGSHEKPGMGEVMLKTNLKGRYDGNVNVVRKRGNVRQEQVDQLNMYEKPGMREVMPKTNLKTCPEGSYDKVNEVKERDGDMYEEPEQRDVMGNINPEGSYDEVNMRKEKAGDMYKKLIKSKSKRDEFKVTEEMKDVNKEYEAGPKAHQGRKPNKYEKLETREVMLKTNPEGKYDEVRKRGNMR